MSSRTSEVDYKNFVKAVEGQVYWHVVGNGQRGGAKGYLFLRTYKSVGAALNYAKREGKPVWIVESRTDYLPVNGQHSQAACGGFDALRWNSGSGLVGDFMPLLALVG